MPTERAKFSGLIAAAHTPFRPDGELALDVIDRLARRYARSGIRGVFICGTTGEFSALSIDERRRIAERWAECGRRSGLQVLVHVGGVSARDARSLTAHASEIGAHAVSAIAPSAPRPPRVEELVAYCSQIAGGAPDLPFFLYHIPSLSGVSFPVKRFLESAASEIPSLAGAKFSHLDLVDVAECVHLEGGRHTILFGADEALLSALVVGVTGAVGSTYGLYPRVSLGIFDAFERADLARALELQLVSVRAVRACERYGAHPAMKAVLRWTGIDAGPVRAPQRALEESEYRALIDELERSGLASWFTHDNGS
jgi:N-acetylneuraminate lyase